MVAEEVAAAEVVSFPVASGGYQAEPILRLRTKSSTENYVQAIEWGPHALQDIECHHHGQDSPHLFSFFLLEHASA